ncbi:protein of unknown function DUF1555 ['Nostoc azollae' 0708]|uniref:Ice-binding protein C-terminal domain-containing protein n=1 Tax=Nostoc azollae (strain 0708) TaxID=551115 RepID=D7DWB2_NOSA0|nr:PEP-CTERM sorting domain-containing protein [Trichormus azollae]ADI64029.1 protein of unknown function DUF1555 ['Nostoc azollae' 0708]
MDIIGNGYSNFLPGNGLYLDPDGSTSNAGKLSSKSIFVFGARDLVNLLFKLAGDQRNNGNNSVMVSLGSLFNESFILPPTQDFTTFTDSFTVASDTSAKLAFEGVGEDNIGLLIDDVTLTKSVPEPASLIVIFGLGAFGVTSLPKRKQEKVAVKA